ncbi:DNA-binding response regulator, OmpR family, contains REC and winged-helix (wHTH) domain [Hathewaya proteolytica DSM 3090]|uniref:Stage 0 sporulation protein A homolog n=1 Tax=Hathewaya proteolytica DSM 3090 TaxID=1121331 RepID=A0A1M6K5M7_9CLOT|nr:response regulator transcription factor [Hathewaya proteolytica]SHJ54294.1 DNA-binding response regulator, OmpR family, contains REC and winged-helix (wHTH) domain [Hathewaya proteolytica DSM 3090]
MEQYNVLVVDDDREIRESIEIYLKNEGINVVEACHGMEALKRLEENHIHLIIMDLMMPKMDGMKATFKIRETRNIPIIILSAKSEDTDKILGLNIGADDYMTKPFNPLELVARVKSQLRRYMDFGHVYDENEINIRGVCLDKNTKIVRVNGEDVTLTPTEYKILELLMEHSGKVYSIQEIYTKVWKEPFYNGENTVAVHIRRIREKIEINPKEPEYLKVVWGIGYKFEK